MQEGSATALSSRTWPDGIVRLVVLLGTCPEPTRGKVAALYKNSSDERALRRALQPLCAVLLRSVAASLASGLGSKIEALLQFADPVSTVRELETADALLCRLDRCWGGIPMLLLDARDEVWLRWPGPITGRLIALRGSIELDGAMVASHDHRPMPRNAGLKMGRGALVLLRRPPLGTILETIKTAGISVPDVIAAACETKIAVSTAVGPLTYDAAKKAATFNSRYIRLSDHEATALEVLLRRPGCLTGRSEFNQALGFEDERALDRVMLHLRNKFGDGLITTVYGAGHILETAKI